MARRQTDTKTRILRIAASHFASHGWQATRIDDILAAGGITKGAFYHYFRSKQSLCEGVIEQAFSECQLLAQSMDRNLPPGEQIPQFISRLNQLNASGQWLCLRLFVRLSADSYESHPAISVRLQRFWQWILQYLENLNHLHPSREPKMPSGGSEDTLELSARQILYHLVGSIILDRMIPFDGPH